jgi:hypothetical protein
LVGAGFVAADLGDVDADGVGEGLLGESALLADGGEAVGEVHVSEPVDEGACWGVHRRAAFRALLTR